MIHGVDTHDRIERVIPKRQALIYIRNLELGACDIRLTGLLICRLNSLLIDIKTSDSTVEFPGKVKSRSTRAAGNFKDMIAWREIESTAKPVIFIRGDPAVLSNILPERLPSHSSQHVFLKVTVGAVV
jgi:hypothetical protein